VERVASLPIQAVTVDTLTELLGLPGMRVTQYALEAQGSERCWHLFCEHEHDVAICPRCLKVAQGGYDHKDRCVRPLAVWGLRTWAHFPQRHFECAGGL